MSTVQSVVYQGLAMLAMLAHIIVNGLFTLVTLNLSSAPGTELPLLMLKGVVLASWFGLGWFAWHVWARNSWLVVAAPIVSFAILWVVNWIGANRLDSFIPYGP